MIRTLDACAMIAYLRDEPGADVVEEALMRPGDTCLAHVLNLAEVYYDFARAVDEATAGAAIQDLYAGGVTPRDDVDEAFWQEAARYKAAYRRISLADCFCVTLARRVGGDLLTSDHHELGAIAPLGIVPIRFIR